MDSQRRPLLVANWKMHFTLREAQSLARRFRSATSTLEHVDFVVAPPFTSLAVVAEELNGSSIRVAAQNMHPRADGAFTGEVSGPMIRDAGATWVILGHSERRAMFHETNEGVAEKLASAIEQGFVPIVCVGDSLEARAAWRSARRRPRAARGGGSDPRDDAGSRDDRVRARVGDRHGRDRDPRRRGDDAPRDSRPPRALEPRALAARAVDLRRTGHAQTTRSRSSTRTTSTASSSARQTSNTFAAIATLVERAARGVDSVHPREERVVL